ncbi:hypothetical protein CCP3SC15_2050002 [Gammaproteobacteria bacterium]
MDSTVVKSAIEVGAVYGAIQVIAQLAMAVFPSNTVVWRVAKWFLSGAARPPYQL